MTNVFPEPGWSQTQLVNPPPPALSAGEGSPSVITGILRRLVQAHFCSADNILNPLLKGYVWTPRGTCDPATPAGISSSSSNSAEVSCNTDAESHLLIAMVSEFDPKTIQVRPAIFIKREAIKNQTFSLRNQTTQGHADKSSPVLLAGVVHQLIVIGNHSLICVGKTGGEADRLAEELYYRLTLYQPVIIEEFSLGDFKVSGMSEVKDLTTDAGKAFYAVVSIDWSYVLRWELIKEAPLLKRYLQSVAATS